MPFPSARFLAAGASFDEAGAIGAEFGAGTHYFDGRSESEVREVIDRYRARELAAEDEPEPSEPSDDEQEEPEPDPEPPRARRR